MRIMIARMLGLVACASLACCGGGAGQSRGDGGAASHVDGAVGASDGAVATSDGAVATSDGGSSPAAAPFPRLGGIEIGNPRDFSDPAYQAALAKLGVMVLPYYPGFAPGGESMDNCVKDIKALNPNALVFLYTNSDSQYLSPPGPADAPLIDKINAMKWWLYTDTSFTNPVPSFFGHNQYTINNSPYTPKDSAGDDSIDFLVKWYVSNYYKPNPDIDGLYMDNVFAQPRVAGDWYRNGVVLQKSDPKAGAAVQAGYERWFSLVRTLMPGKYQIGNIGGSVGGTNVPAGYKNMVDGGVMEAMIGKSYSIEGYAGWQAMMKRYTQVMQLINPPKLAIFNQWGDPTDYQAFRYGFASCLMNNGYYSFTSNADGYTGVVLFDEYGAKLGKAMTAPPTAAWQTGVWRRDFTNGIALVNPKGNGPQTVQLGGTFVKIKGSQDPTVNNGQKVTSVTLKDRDGIILLRNAP